MKYLYISLTKYVQDIYEKFYKILVGWEYLKKSEITGQRVHIHEYVVKISLSPVWPTDSKQSPQNPGNNLMGIDKQIHNRSWHNIKGKE